MVWLGCFLDAFVQRNEQLLQIRKCTVMSKRAISAMAFGPASTNIYKSSQHNHSHSTNNKNGTNFKLVVVVVVVSTAV